MALGHHSTFHLKFPDYSTWWGRVLVAVSLPLTGRDEVEKGLAQCQMGFTTHHINVTHPHLVSSKNTTAEKLALWLYSTGRDTSV